jgi:hypothetical protein
VPQLLELKARSDVAIRFRVQIEIGDGRVAPPDDVVNEVNKLLAELKDGLVLE